MFLEGTMDSVIIIIIMQFYDFANYVTTLNIMCRTSIQPVASYM